MLTEVKNHFRVTLKSIKYNVLKEMINPASFISNVIFMMLNNASFIIQWLILYSLKDNIGGYTLDMVLLLWALSAASYGFSHVFAGNAHNITELIADGKLDAYLVQPKNVLINIITSYTKISAIGDILYGYIILFIVDFSFYNLLLFTLFSIMGAVIMTSVAIVYGSLAFFIVKADAISYTMNGAMTNFSTYPEGIFKSGIKMLLYIIIPVGFSAYIPISIMNHFNLSLFLIVIGINILFVAIAFIIFNRGLKRYSSSSLMSARI